MMPRERGRSTPSNHFFSDSWAVGFWRTDHADHHDGRGLDNCFEGIRGISLTARRQGTERPEVSRSSAVFRGSQHHLAGSPGKVWALEQRLEAVLALEPVRNFRGFLRCAGGNERNGASGADVRFHRSARPCLGGGRKRGQHDQALGRSRGGFSTKIHLKTDFDGLPIAFHLTGGEASDSRNFETLLDIGPDINPRAAERHSVLIGYFPCERARLGKANMMGVNWLSSANQARLRGNELDMIMV